MPAMWFDYHEFVVLEAEWRDNHGNDEWVVPEVSSHTNEGNTGPVQKQRKLEGSIQ